MLLTTLFCQQVFSFPLSALITSLAEEAVEKFRLKSDFISTPLTDCYRFTSRYTANGEAQPLWLLW